jgi:hypothetical protein
MDKPKVAPTLGGMAEPKVYVRVQRGGQPPMPWTWEIHREGDPPPRRCAVRGYRSAEDAWEAGQAALTSLKRP